MKKISSLFKLVRFELPFSAGICVVMGQLLALGEFADLTIITFGFLSVFFISASILVLNDYFDVETDRINAPDRPIPSGIVSPSEALVFSILLLLGGLFLSYLISLSAVLCSAALILIGFLYNRKFKKSGLPGNLMVSFSVGMTFVFGAITVGLPFSKTALFFAVIAALIDLGEEISADAMDMQGDLLIESNSIAIKHGREAALKTGGTIFLLVILLSTVPFILDWFTGVYLLPIALMDTAIAYSTVKLLRSKGQQGRKYIRTLYLGATAGLLVFLVMRMVGV